MKDNFSRQSSLYVKFRPVYPKSVFDFIFKYLREQGRAWDCGTGNGQVASVLSEYFDEVVASDISAQQLNNAPELENVTYVNCAEQLINYPDNYFDLVTVAQAIHWFDLDKFYKEVKRVGKPGSLLAVWGYGLLKINDKVDEVISAFYETKIGNYWDWERRLIDDSYSTIPFPFDEIPAPGFNIRLEWTLQEMEGYLNTWSSVQKYIIAHNDNPVSEIVRELYPVWGNEKLAVNFPIFLRLGKIN